MSIAKTLLVLSLLTLSGDIRVDWRSTSTQAGTHVSVGLHVRGDFRAKLPWLLKLPAVLKFER